MHLRDKTKRFALALVLAALLSTIIGSGIALASLSTLSLSTGWWYYYPYHYDTDYPGYEGLTDYYTGQIWSGMGNNGTSVEIDSTRYYSGYASSSLMYFGNLWIFDKLGYESELYQGYNNFASHQINGIDWTANTDWRYDYLSASDNFVQYEQHIWLADPLGGGYDTIGYDDNILWNGLGTRPW